MPRNSVVPCPVTAYAKAVIAGNIVAGRLVRLACERHLRDLKTAKQRGLVWSPESAARAFAVFPFLKHSKGEWAGHPLELAPWQQFIVGVLFGWLRSDGTRRFRMAYNEIARKNGKSTLAAAIGLILAFFTGEPGQEVYTIATKLSQARIVHSEAVRMRNASPGLKDRIKGAKDNLHVLETNSKYEPLVADPETLDGLNPGGVIVDELHAHKNREMLDVVETATGARREPLIFVITTAGVAGEPSVCSEMHDYGVKVLEGVVDDDTFFVFIAALDDGDRWDDESVWAKANPNLGISCKLDDLRRKAQKAKEMPSALPTFQQKHLNMWVQALEVWLPDTDWMRPSNAKPVDEKTLDGQDCYGGLDLANTLDMTAMVLIFPRGDMSYISRPAEPDPKQAPAGDQGPSQLIVAQSYSLMCKFWVPEAKAAERERTHRANYRSWIQRGLITVTDGDVTDYDVVKADILSLRDRFRIVKLAYDRHNATQLANQLTLEGLDCHDFNQSIRNYNEPMMLAQKLAIEGRLQHGGHEVLRWMVGNVIAWRDGLGRCMPSRKKSKDKIDGFAAMLMALGEALNCDDFVSYVPGGMLS